MQKGIRFHCIVLIHVERERESLFFQFHLLHIFLSFFLSITSPFVSYSVSFKWYAMQSKIKIKITIIIIWTHLPAFVFFFYYFSIIEIFMFVSSRWDLECKTYEYLAKFLDKYPKSFIRVALKWNTTQSVKEFIKMIERTNERKKEVNKSRNMLVESYASIQFEGNIFFLSFFLENSPKLSLDTGN